jgi:hypothetical protein
MTRKPDGVRRLSRSITAHSPAVARVTTADSDGATGMSSHAASDPPRGSVSITSTSSLTGHAAASASVVVVA